MADTQGRRRARVKKIAARRCILVVGMHRSGTSALTRVLNLLGARISYPLQPPAFDNERGFWEPSEVVAIHETLFAALGITHDSYYSLTKTQLASGPAVAARADLIAFVERTFADDVPLVLIKDPRICRLLPLWREVLAATGFAVNVVLPLRNPLEVARSLRQRNGYHLAKGQLMWLRHVLNAERETRDVRRTATTYDALLTDWRAVARQVAGDLDIDWVQHIDAMAPEIEAFLEPDLRHHTVKAGSFASDLAWVTQAWEAVPDLVANPLATPPAFERVFAEMAHAESAFGPLERAAAEQHAAELGARDDLLQLRENELLHVRHAERVLIGDLAETRAATEAASLQVGNLQTSLALAQASNTDLIAINGAQRDVHAQVLQTSQALAEHVRAAQAEVARMNAEIQAMARTLAGRELELTRELAAREGDLARATARADILAERTKALADDLATATDRHAGLTQHIAIVETANNALTRALTDADARLTKTAATIAALETAAREAQSAAAPLKAQLDDAARQIEQHTRTVSALQEQVAQLTDEHGEMVRAANILQAENATLRIRCNDAEIRISALAQVNAAAMRVSNGHEAAAAPPARVVARIIDLSRALVGLPSQAATRRARRLATAMGTIAVNNAFDTAYYLSTYPDIAAAGVDPLRHFCVDGWREGRNPNAQFDTLFYLGTHPDVMASQANPLLHWLRHGRAEGRLTHALQAIAAPLALAPTAPAPSLQSGGAEDDVTLLAATGAFDEVFYLARNPDVARANLDPLQHFCDRGWREGRTPCAGFHTGFYLEHNRDVAEAGINPFLHWLRYGRAEGRPSAPASIGDEWGIGARAFNPAIIFVSHEASRTGAPMVLLSMLKWLKANTTIEFGIVIGADGPLRNEFRALAPCLFMDAYPHEERRAKLRVFCGLNVQAVYLNTIVAGIYGAYMTFLNASFITHVHEMENVFRLYEDAFAVLRGFCRDFIAVSAGSVEAIERRTIGHDVRITRLPPFIDRFAADDMPTAPPVQTIYACGTLETRKGPDLFCDIAEHLLRRGFTAFRMAWIGPTADFDLAAEIARRGLGDHVEWLGLHKQPRHLLRHGAVFVLPSREDAFPLVCLEAAEQGLPVICFDERAGSMHTFVEDDAGVVVPYLDTGAMANAIAALLVDTRRRRALGARAAAKVAERHTAEVACPAIMRLLPPLEASHATDEFTAYREQIDRAEIVSFDIFDTLITRRLANPNTVFDVVEHRLSHNQAAAVGLFEMRMQTAGAVLGKHQGRRDDVSIDDIYEEMAFFRDPAIEKATEIDVVAPHPLGARLFDYARAQGKHVIIVSDMYLDELTICAMLAAGGIAGWDRLFLSSKLGLKKDTGRLFELVTSYARERGVAPRQILHIGDNWEGDVHKARANGLRAIRFTPLYETTHRKFPIAPEKAQQLSQIGRIWNDFITQATRLWIERNPGLTADLPMKLGFELTGPLAAMLAMYVHTQAERSGTQKIVFLARDGRIIKKAFDTLYRDEIAAGAYESIYAHLSRAVVVPATLQNPLSSSDLYFLIEGLHLHQMPVRYFLAKAGLDADDSAIARKLKTRFPGPDHVPHWDELHALTSLMVDLTEAIHAANTEARALFLAYLRQHNLDRPGKVMVVDVGWLLNIQSRVHQFCRDMGIDEQIFGVYVGSRERVDKSLPHACLLFDGGDPRCFAELIEANTTLFEVLFSAAEPSARALAWGPDGRVEVALKPLAMPRTKEFVIAQKIHFGAEAFFADFAEARARFFPDRISRDMFASAFEALVQSSDPEVHHEFGSFEVALGGHHEFHARERLIKGTVSSSAAPARPDEYFAPMLLGASSKGARHIVIVTSAGLDNGSTRYRAIHLGQSLGALGLAVTLLHAATPETLFASEIAACDTVVFQRCFRAQGEVGAMLDHARGCGKRCVMEIDDLVFPEFLPVIGSVVGGEWDSAQAQFVAEAYAAMMNEMDAAIVSTALIGEFVGRRWQIPWAVYRNRVQVTETSAIDPALPLRMLFASGTFSHKEDFALVAEAVRAVLAAHPDAHLTLLGATQVPEALLALPNVSSYPLLPYQEMLKVIARHNLMLVPLSDNLFNHAKSNVKFVEAASQGVPVLASDVREYAFAIRDGDNGLIARTPADWGATLAALAADRAPLRAIGDCARAFVEDHALCIRIDAETAAALHAVLFGSSWLAGA